MILWLMLALAAGTCQAIPTNRQITPETPLDSLTLDELDQLLSEKLVTLQVDLLKTYEQQLREHEETLDHLHRHRRAISLPPRPTIGQDDWHSYVYDTRPSREIASVTDLVTINFTNVHTVVDIFPVALDNIHAIYKLDSGNGYILQDDTMHLLTVRNQWTKSPTGCSCPGQASDTRCACCALGSVLCQVSASGVSNTCVEDSQINSHTCSSQSPRSLELDNAIAFEYHTYSEGVQQVVVIAKGENIHFYRLDKWGLQDFHSLKGHNTINLDSPVTHLGYGEMFVEQFGTVTRKRYLFTFGLDSSSKRYYEIVTNPQDFSIETGLSMMWDTTGTSMKVWQNGGRVIIGVQDGTNLNIHELTSDRWGRQQISLQQVLSLPAGVTSWRSYATGFENFLIATTPTFARVYMESRGEYQILQNLLPTGSIASFKEMVPVTLPSCKDEVMLVTGSGTSLQIFVWDGTTGLYTLANDTSLAVDITDWTKGFGDVRSISTAVPKLILQSTTGVVGINVLAEMQHIEDPVWDESVALKNRKQYLENEYRSQREVMLDIEDRLNHSVDTTTATVDITGDVTILGGINLDKTLTVTDFSANNLVFPNTDLTGISYDGYKAHLENIANSSAWLQSIDNTLTSIELELQDAVSLTTTKKIDGRKVIVDGLTVQDMNVDSAVFQKVLDDNGNAFPLTSRLEGLVKFADLRKITGKKTFTTSLDVTNLETSALDDIPVSDVATTTGSYAVTGNVNFASTLQAKNVHLPKDGTVGGVDLTNAITLNGPGKLGSTVFNKNLTVLDNLQVDSTDVDGVIIEQLYRNALTKAGGKLKGPLEFTNDVTAKSLTASLLSGVSSPIFLSTTVFKDQDVKLTGKIRVPTLTAKGLYVRDMVNGKDFPSDFPLKTDKTLNLGTKSFNHLTCVDLTVENSLTVDGIQFDKLVTLHRPQVIVGRKTLTEGVDIQGSLNVASSLVAGVNFDDLYANLTAIQNPMGKGFDIYFKNYVHLPTVDYKGNMNNLNIVDLGRDIIYSTDSAAAISGTKSFNLPVSISHATFDSTFNGKSFDDLVHSFSTKPIAGVKTFKKPVTFSSTVDVTGLVDRVDLKQLFDSALYLDKAGQVVTGRKTFTGTVSAGELDVQGRVSGVDFNTILAKSGDQVFTVPQKLAAASFGALDANQIDMSDGFTMNDIDISVLDSTRMSRKNPTPHSGVLTVNGMVSVLGSLDAVNIGGHNVAQLKSNIVTDDADSIISSDLSFASLTVKDSVSTANKVGANGQNISRINENAVFLAGNNAMTGSVTWGDLDLQGDVAVGGLVNGKDLQVVHNDAVYTDASSVQVTGKKTFAEFSVKGNINAETTNGIDLSKRLVTLDTDQDIVVPYEFFTLHAEKNLNLGGTFDAVDLVALDSTALKELQDETNNIYLEKVQAGTINILRNLNAVNVNDRLNDAVRLQAQDVKISGKKTFHKDTTFNNLDVTTLNGEDLTYYLSHAVRKNRPISLASNIKVNGLVSAPSVTANSLTIEGTVDNVDYKTLMKNVVLLDDSKSHGIKLAFEDDVSVKGALGATSLNGFDLATNYLTTNTMQSLSPNVEFESITTASITVDGFVNSKKLPDEVANTLNVNGGQTVTGMKSISGIVNVANNVEVTGNINNIKMATEAIYLKDASTVNGRLKFSNGLLTSSLTSSTNMISDIDMSDLSTNAWYYNESATISASMIFDSSVTMKDSLTVVGTIDKFNIGQVYNDAKQALNQYSTYNEGIKSEYAVKCPLILEAYKDTQKAIFDADYFRLVQEIALGKVHHASTSFWASGTTYIIISWKDECSSTLYRFESPGKLVHVQTLAVSGHGKDWLAIEQGQEIFLVMAASSEGNACTKQNSVVWKMSNGALSVYQDLLPGTKVSANHGVVYITAPSATHSYIFDTKTLLFNFVNTATTEMDSILTSKSGHSVASIKLQGSLVLFVDGQQLSSQLSKLQVDDSVLFEQQGKILLLAAVTRNPLSGIEYSLDLYGIDPTENTLNWLDSKPLLAAATLTSFYSGNAITGKTIAVVMQENYYCPTVYTVLGSELRFFSDLATPKVNWAIYISIPNEAFSEVKDHYLLVGKGDSSKLLYLEMRGLTHEALDRTCHVDDFKYPELIPRV